MPPIPLVRALALLPPSPSPPTFEALKAAYHVSLFSILRQTSSSSQSKAERCVLDVAIPCPHLWGQQTTPRSTLYETSQTLLAGVYKLVCIIAARQNINVEDANGLDVHVHLVAYPRDGKLISTDGGRPETDTAGPMIAFASFARSKRPWTKVFSVETEAGERLLANFVLHNRHIVVQKVRGGIVAVSNSSSIHEADSKAQDRRKHAAVAVGGTFDHLHIGHKLLLSMTAFMLDSADENASPRSLTIGITGDELLKNKKFAEQLESWAARQESVHSYLRSILDFSPHGDDSVHREEQHNEGPNGHAVIITLPSKTVIKYVEIWDPFGPTITDKDISALVISAETRSGGSAVNSKREESAWPPLEVFEVDVLDADEETDQTTSENVQDSFRSKLSSTEIRRKLVERGAASTKM